MRAAGQVTPSPAEPDLASCEEPGSATCATVGPAESGTGGASGVYSSLTLPIASGASPDVMPMATVQSRAYCLRPGLTPSWASAEPPVAPDELPLLPVLAPTYDDGLSPPVEDVDEEELDAIVAESQRERWEAMLDRAVAAMHQEPAFDAATAAELAQWEAAMADPAGAVAAALAEDTAANAACCAFASLAPVVAS